MFYIIYRIQEEQQRRATKRAYDARDRDAYWDSKRPALADRGGYGDRLVEVSNSLTLILPEPKVISLCHSAV